MADDFAVTAGTGTTIRAVEKSSKKAQVVVLDLGGAGAESLLTTTLPVTPAATESHLGALGGNAVQIDIVIDTAAAAYSSGDMVGTVQTITSIARVNGGTGKITGIRVEDDAVQSVAGELWIFDATVTAPADNAAWSISDADAQNNVTVIPVALYYASALNSIAPVGNLSLPFKCTGSVKNLFACWVTRGTPTYTANALHIRIFADQD
jgi:hypothetical protein